MRRLCVLLILATLVACSGNKKGEVKTEDISDLAEKTTLSPRSYSFSREVPRRQGGPVTLTVSGLVEDDYKYTGTVAINKEIVYEEVVLDDARFLRLANASLLETVAILRRFDAPVAEAQRAAGFADPATEAVLLSGGWVFDPQGAPQEFGGDTGASPLDAREVLFRSRFLETLPAYLAKGGTSVEWNPEAAFYIPNDDKFPPKERKSLNEEFIDPFKSDGKRFDVLPKPFDPSITPTNLRDVEDFFMYVSIWTNDGLIRRVGRVLEFPDLEDPVYKDFFQPLKSGTTGQATKDFLKFVQDLKIRRIFKDFYVFGKHGTDGARIEAPANPIRVNLKPAAPVETRDPQSGPGPSETPQDQASPAPEPPAA